MRCRGPASVTPAALIQKSDGEECEALANKEVLEKFAAQGAEALTTSPEDSGGIIRVDIAKWSETVQASGARID